MRPPLLARFLVLLFPTVLLSQPAPPTASTPAATPEPLALFTRLVGEWEGEAWAIMGPGKPHVLRQTERVEAVAGGTAFAVRGTGHERMADGTERITFEAFGVIFVDHDRITPRMRTFTMQGANWTDPNFTVDEQGYRWSMTDPRAGRIEYVMQFDADGRWIETGRMSRDDGKTWTPIFEMKLSKVR